MMFLSIVHVYGNTVSSVLIMLSKQY